MRRLGLVVLVLAGCHRPLPQVAAAPLSAAGAPDDPVVATVDGRPIRASDVALQAKSAGETARQALDDLITAETLVSEAARRHLDDSPDAREAARAESVRRLLAVDFEAHLQPADVPDRLVHHAYARNLGLYDHSEYVDVWHILVPVPKNAPDALRTAARATAEEIARRAHGVASVEAFKALAAEVPRPPGIDPYHVEHIITARDGWVLTSFSYPAFELTRPGQTSGVVETSYGYHVIYLVKRIPPRHLTVAQAAPEIRAQLFPLFEREQFKRYLEAAMHRHEVVEYPEHLPRADLAALVP